MAGRGRAALPAKPAELAAVPGIGQNRLEAYGSAILEAVAATD